MRIRIAALLLVLFAAPAWCAPADGWLASAPKFYRIAHDRAAVDRLLGELQTRYPDFQQRLRAVALLRVGTPYVLGCLGEEKGRDKGPVFRLDESDCTVNVLTSSALAHARTWNQARTMMDVLNYYPAAKGTDPVRFENRIHFTEDRLLSSRWFRIVTPPGVHQEAVTLTLNRGQDGKRLIDIPWEKKVTLRWVAVARVTPAVLASLPKYVAGVAFVRKKLFPKGLAIAHEGMIVDRRWLVHADSIGKKTARVDFLDFLRKNSDWFDGVVFYEFVR
jgi:hypothetical protein